MRRRSIVVVVHTSSKCFIVSKVCSPCRQIFHVNFYFFGYFRVQYAITFLLHCEKAYESRRQRRQTYLCSSSKSSCGCLIYHLRLLHRVAVRVHWEGCGDNMIYNIKNFNADEVLLYNGDVVLYRNTKILFEGRWVL